MRWRGEFHERLREDKPAVRGSERGFGIAFTAVFSIIGLLPLAFGEHPRWWALGAAGVLLGVTTLRPVILVPLNRVWFRVSLAVSCVTTPVIIGILFYGVVTPTGLIMRLLGKDPLRRRCDRNADSYWIRREPPGPTPESMRNQF